MRLARSRANSRGIPSGEAAARTEVTANKKRIHLTRMADRIYTKAGGSGNSLARLSDLAFLAPRRQLLRAAKGDGLSLPGCSSLHGASGAKTIATPSNQKPRPGLGGNSAKDNPCIFGDRNNASSGFMQAEE